MTIKLLVLKSGEDVVADVTEMMAGEEDSIDNPQRVIGYFLDMPVVVKLRNTTPLTEDEVNPDKPDKTQFSLSMYPWQPLANETRMPIPTDWVVTMVTPVSQVLTMYQKDVLKDVRKHKESSQSDNPNKPKGFNITD
tara:strand:+ start:566 stop:976 length:411 start_codon:yes stop_codon:yes gene_type:complete